MSRIGRYPVAISSDVHITLEKDKITAKGSKGELSLNIHPKVEVRIDSRDIWIQPREEGKFSRALWGTTRANIHNMVLGVSRGFFKRLEIVGVGYRASAQGQTLTLALGFSHDVIYSVPYDISVRCETPTTVIVSGPSKERVGQIAAEIRAYRPPEPYKGKGIRYADEHILRKEGKKK